MLFLQAQAHLKSQISALASGLNVSTAHGIAMLRRHGWSYGDVMRALDAQPGLLKQYSPATSREQLCVRLE